MTELDFGEASVVNHEMSNLYMFCVQDYLIGGFKDFLLSSINYSRESVAWVQRVGMSLPLSNLSNVRHMANVLFVMTFNIMRLVKNVPLGFLLGHNKSYCITIN